MIRPDKNIIAESLKEKCSVKEDNEWNYNKGNWILCLHLHLIENVVETKAFAVVSEAAFRCWVTNLHFQIGKTDGFRRQRNFVQWMEPVDRPPGAWVAPCKFTGNWTKLWTIVLVGQKKKWSTGKFEVKNDFILPFLPPILNYIILQNWMSAGSQGVWYDKILHHSMNKLTSW